MEANDKYYLDEGVMVPTQEEIARQTAAIRDGWDDTQLAHALGKLTHELRAETTWEPIVAELPKLARKSPED